MRVAILATIVAAAGALAPAAAAHSIVLPFSSRPVDLQLYTVIVPTESDKPTTEVALKVPEGVDFLLVKETPGWKARVERANDRIDVIRWTGNSPPDFYAEFRFIARNPILERDLPWKITQTYEGGETVRWIGPPESEFPASITRLSEQAVPVDVVTGLNGGDTSAGASATGGGESETGSDAGGESTDAVARVGAAAAILLGLAALGATLMRARRREGHR